MCILSGVRVGIHGRFRHRYQGSAQRADQRLLRVSRCVGCGGTQFRRLGESSAPMTPVETAEASDFGPVLETWNALRLGLVPELSAFPVNGSPLGGCLFGDDGRWLTLPAIRESIRGWRPYPAIDDEASAALPTLPTTDGAWIEFLARNLLGRPELYGARLSAQTRELFEAWTHQRVFEVRCSVQDAAVLASLAEITEIA